MTEVTSAESISRQRVFNKLLIKLLLVGLFLWVLALATAGAATPTTSRIINGTPAFAGEFPWMAVVMYSDGSPRDLHYCGGALIAQRWVLTAAHCVGAYYLHPPFPSVPLEEMYIQVALGSSQLDDPNLEIHAVSEIVLHPKASLIRNSFDLALLKLATPVRRPTLALPVSQDYTPYESGRILTVMGWGMTDPNYPVLPVDLQRGEVPVQADAFCLQAFGRFFEPESMFCAGVLASSRTAADGTDSCYGDSGGPAVFWDGERYRAAGVVSWGFECGGSRFPSVYAKIAAAVDWIEETIDPTKRLGKQLATLYPEILHSYAITLELEKQNKRGWNALDEAKYLRDSLSYLLARDRVARTLAAIVDIARQHRREVVPIYRNLNRVRAVRLKREASAFMRRLEQQDYRSRDMTERLQNLKKLIRALGSTKKKKA